MDYKLFIWWLTYQTHPSESPRCRRIRLRPIISRRSVEGRTGGTPVLMVRARVGRGTGHAARRWHAPASGAPTCRGERMYPRWPASGSDLVGIIGGAGGLAEIFLGSAGTPRRERTSSLTPLTWRGCRGTPQPSECPLLLIARLAASQLEVLLISHRRGTVTSRSETLNGSTPRFSAMAQRASGISVPDAADRARP